MVNFDAEFKDECDFDSNNPKHRIKDKNIKEMLRGILPVADAIIVTRFSMATDVSRNASTDASMIKDKLLRMKYRGKILVEENSKKALKKAFELAAIQQFNNSTIIVVTGSLYLVGEIRNLLFQAL